MTQDTESLPVLPLRDVVVYPHMVIPLFVGREKSIKALDKAMEGNKQILLVAQKSAAEDEPGQDTGLKPLQPTGRASAKAPQQISDAKPKAKRSKPAVAGAFLDFCMSVAPLNVPCGSGILNSQHFNSGRAIVPDCFQNSPRRGRRHNPIGQA